VSLSVDFLIVGQGLAGSLLARKLLLAGKTVHIVDRHRKHSASRVAAGMFNPIVFKRLNKSWMADDALPIAEAFFKEWGSELGMVPWHEVPVLRIFPNQQAANDWLVRSEAEGFNAILKTHSHPDGEAQQAPFGYGIVEGSGYVELGTLLDTQREQWLASGQQTEADWTWKETTLTDSGCTWRNIHAQHLVLCQGHALLDEGPFSYLPMNRTKGEVLDVHQPGLERTHVINNGRWAIPLGEGKFRLGATYDWHTADPTITPEARDLLLQKLQPVVGENPQILDQRGGIRPTVKDRRPLLGTHPKWERAHVFNGLGTRGVMIGPMLGEWMLKWLFEREGLTKVVDIQRFPYSEEN
jgi:glycine/D-amino acid oxidase-like deaminating enzyme